MRSFIAIALLSILSASMTACGTVQPSQFTAADGSNNGPQLFNSPAHIRRTSQDQR